MMLEWAIRLKSKQVAALESSDDCGDINWAWENIR
jgi:hypothetical protein